ncbi:MAG: hypothetical protein RLZZ241_450 [Bacteroidota bacterium]|jgi:GNAT superfamily N-acetyltransferase
MNQHTLKLVDVTENPERLFGHLPASWKKEAQKIWPEISSGSRILVLQEGEVFKGGGIVSNAIFPDMTAYEELARHWYAKKYYYIGFLFVPAKFRAHGYGSIWLREIRTVVSAKGFWLSIEKIALLKFYVRSGFHLEQIIHIENGKEWLLVSPKEDW